MGRDWVGFARLSKNKKHPPPRDFAIRHKNQQGREPQTKKRTKWCVLILVPVVGMPRQVQSPRFPMVVGQLIWSACITYRIAWHFNKSYSVCTRFLSGVLIRIPMPILLCLLYFIFFPFIYVIINASKKGDKMFKKAINKVETMNQLEQMQKELSKLGPVPNGKEIYDYAVKFFNIIVKFQDNFALNVDMFPKTVKSADTLRLHITNAGRNEYGWVRAKRGEPVTLHNLYLGNVYGIWTGTAASFKESSDKDTQQIIQNQIKSFINSHREPMINLISEVLQKNNKPDNILVKTAMKIKSNTK